jgi:hypothetical protein
MSDRLSAGNQPCANTGMVLCQRPRNQPSPQSPKPRSPQASPSGHSLGSRTAAAEVHAAETERRAERSLQLVSSIGQLSALIKVGKTTVQIEGDSFAVSTSD